MQIFHIVDRATWAVASESGEYLPLAYEADGFVHFSFAHQVAQVANTIYRTEPDPIVVEFESEAIPAELRVEDSYDVGEEFPHIYGPIPTAVMTAQHALTRDQAGDWVFNPDAATDPSSTDH